MRLLSSARGGAEEHAGHVHRRRAAVRAHRLPARDRAGLARRRGDRRRRGRRLRAAAGLQAPAGADLRRSTSRRRSSPTTLPSATSSPRSRVAVDRKGVNAKVVREGLNIRVVEGMTGPAARPQRGRSDRRRRALDVRPRQGRRAAARDHRAQGEERRSRRRRDAGAHRALGADQALLRGDALAGAALADRAAALVARRRQHRPSRSPAAGPRSTSSGSRPTVSRKPQDAHFQVTATGKIVIRPSAPGLQLDVPATAKAIAAAAFSADKRTANLVVRVANPQRTTEIAKTMGIDSVVSSYTTTYGGTPGRLNNVQLVAEADRRHPDRAGRHVLVQRHDGRADGGEGIPGGAGDHQRRAPERARRRDLPGLDDGVQRGLRRRPADHRAHEPRALHLATIRSGATRP